MFERMRDSAIRAIMNGQEAGRKLGHNFLGTEQILQGLAGEGTGIAGQVLQQEGITAEAVQTQVETLIGRGEGTTSVEMPLTPKGKEILFNSLKVSEALGHDYIDSGHLLLGLLMLDAGVALQILNNLGVDPQDLEAKIHAAIQDQSP